MHQYFFWYYFIYLFFYFQVIGSVLFNQTIVGLPVSYFSYHLMKWRGFPPLRELPTFHWVLAELALHILVEEISFYYSHR